MPYTSGADWKVETVAGSAAIGTVAQGTGAAATSAWAVRLSDGTVFTDTVAFASVNTTQSTVITSAERIAADMMIQDAAANVTNRLRSAKDLYNSGSGVGGGATMGSVMGGVAIAHGSNPTAVTAANFSAVLMNRHAIPFHIGGHPNIVTVRANYTSAQTDTAVATVSTGSIFVITGFMFTCSNANTVNVSAIIGMGATNTPTGTAFGDHQGIAPGSGYGRGNGAGIIAIGADGEDIRVTTSAATGGSISIVVTYFTIPS